MRTTRRSLIVFGLGTVLYVVLALTQSWWWWLCAALFFGLLVLTILLRARMDRRLAMLSASY